MSRLATSSALPVFRRDGDLFRATGHARGPWDPDQQHGGAPSALLARAVEALAPELRLARLTVDFLGSVPLGPVTVAARIVKGGRRVQVAEATLTAGERPVLHARAVLVRREAAPGLAAGAPRGPPIAHGPDASGPSPFALPGEGFGSTAMELRVAAGGLPGPSQVWFRLARPLVDDEEPSGAQRAVAAADFGNGVSAAVSWDDWLFVNSDLSVHLARDPVGPWLGLDARTTLDRAASAGLATSVLHDERGPVGVAAQTLFVAPRG